jgi:DNA-binding SARP family transcriptional activator
VATSDPHVLRIYTLGGLKVVWGNNEIPAKEWKRKRAAELLRVLIESPRYRAHAQRLESRLWPDSAKDAARTNLRVKLHDLRSILAAYAPEGLNVRNEPAITFEAGIMGINPLYGPWVDASAFESAAISALEDADRLPTTDALALIDDALALWTGEYFLGEFEEDTNASAGKFARLRRDLVLKSIDLLGNGSPAAERRLADCFDDYPWDELIAETYIGFLAREGRRARAHQIFKRHDEAVRSRSGLEGSRRLATLAGDVTVLAASQRLGVNRLVGRSSELQIAQAVLNGREQGLFDIYGPSGSGKSRFLDEVNEIAQRFGYMTAFARGYRRATAGVIAEQLMHSVLRYADSSTPSPNATSSLDDVAELMGRLFSGSLAVVLVDDAGLVEAEVLRELHERLRHMPHLLVTSRRTSDEAWATSAFSLQLPALPADESLEVVVGSFNGDVSPELARAIRDLWPGELAVLVSSALHVQATGAAVREGTLWIARPDASPAEFLSVEIRTSLQRRIEMLSAFDQSVLEAITIAGINPDVRMISYMLEEEEELVKAAFQHFSDMDLVVRNGIQGTTISKAVRILVAERMERTRRMILVDRAAYFRSAAPVQRTNTERK